MSKPGMSLLEHTWLRTASELGYLDPKDRSLKKRLACFEYFHMIFCIPVSARFLGRGHVNVVVMPIDSREAYRKDPWQE